MSTPDPFGAAAAGAGALLSYVGGQADSRRAHKQWQMEARYRMKQDKIAQAFAEKQFAQGVAQWERDHYYRIRDTVSDAKAAGLHPLFALGSGVSYTGGGSVSGQFIPGQSPSGSFAQDGLSAAAPYVASAIEALRPAKVDPDAALRQRLMAAQIRQLEASASADEAKAGLFNSGAKTTAVNTNAVRSVPKVTVGMPETAVEKAKRLNLPPPRGGEGREYWHNGKLFQLPPGESPASLIAEILGLDEDKIFWIREIMGGNPEHLELRHHPGYFGSPSTDGTGFTTRGEI